jgi:cbb3-type cytochrome oxidase subunit 3
MAMKSTIQKLMLLYIFIILIGCSDKSQKKWDRFHKVYSRKETKLERTHSKYFELNDNTDSNFVITPYGIQHSKHL